MNVLILSYYFPPYNTIGSLRVGKFARYLAELGHSVEVVAASDPALEQRDASLSVEIDARRITYTRWVDINGLPRALVGRLRPQRGAGPGTSPTTVAPTLENLPVWLRPAAKVYMSLTNVPDASLGWAQFAYRAGKRRLLRQRAEIILASGGPFTSFLAASKLSREFRIPWVADLRDLWAEKEPYPFIGARRFVDRWRQQRVLSTAAGVVTVSQPLADTLRDAGVACPISVIYNGYDPADLPPPVQPAAHGPLLLRYAGSLYGNPDLLFEGLSLLEPGRDARVQLLLRGHAPTVMESARRYGVSHLLEVRDPVPYHECLVFQAEADVLLLIQDEGPRWRGVVSGKIFEYMAARRPVLALSGRDSVVNNILESTHAGVTSRDPRAIAAGLSARVDEKRSGGVPHTSGDGAAQFMRVAQTSRLEAFLKSCVSSADTSVNKPMSQSCSSAS